MGRAVALIYPTAGHLTPILPVVAELTRLGEDVVVYGTPRWRGRIEQAGAAYREYRATDEEFNPTIPSAGLFSDMERFAAISARMLPELVVGIRELKADYLLLDTKSLWGRLAAQELGLPAVTMSVVFAIQPGVVPVSQLARMLYGGAPAGHLRDGLLRLGGYFEIARELVGRYCVQAPGIVEYLGNPQRLNIIFTSREFQLDGGRFGPEFIFAGPSIPPARDASCDFPFERLDGRPLVYISLGTTYHNAPEFYAACFEALGERAMQVVLATGGVEMGFERVPSNFLVRSFVPQLEILERARVFVTHGGMGGVNESLYFGVPMIVVPQRGDQHLAARRVAELGAGVALSQREVTAGRVSTEVERLLSDERLHENAGQLSAGMRRSGGYARAAAEIQRYACGCTES